MVEDNDIGAERSRGERNAVTRRISDTIKTDDEISEDGGGLRYTPVNELDQYRSWREKSTLLPH